MMSFDALLTYLWLFLIEQVRRFFHDSQKEMVSWDWIDGITSESVSLSLRAYHCFVYDLIYYECLGLFVF